MKRFLYSLLPTPLRIQGRSFFCNYALDLRDRFSGHVEAGVPPRHLNISGGGPFREFGENTVSLCRTLGNLQPSDHVLDVGCGIGRTALALTSFLERNARYAGFDVIRFAIAWCCANIAPLHSGFTFLHADLFNETYNPKGAISPERYVFPFADSTFSFAIATSLFTHLLPWSTENYLRETGRTLQPGGTFLSTWFLMGEAPKPALSFPHHFENHALHNLEAPEQAVAYRLEPLRRHFASAGLSITRIYQGDWSGRPKEAESFQDIIVATRSE